MNGRMQMFTAPRVGENAHEMQRRRIAIIFFNLYREAFLGDTLIWGVIYGCASVVYFFNLSD